MYLKKLTIPIQTSNSLKTLPQSKKFILKEVINNKAIIHIFIYIFKYLVVY